MTTVSPQQVSGSIFYTSAQSPLFSHLPIDFIQTCALDGISTPPYESCNLAYHVGDVVASVAHNRAKVLAYFNNATSSHSNTSAYKQLLYCTQIHSHHIANATDTFIAQELTHGEIQADGILCDNARYVALIMVADCNPIVLYDANIHAFALLHAGRAGVCSGILTKGVEALQHLGGHTCDIYVFIGSSIRSCCYEIGDALCAEISTRFHSRYICDIHGKKTLDLLSMLRDECAHIGIKNEHIEVLDSCTECDDRLFSYRRAIKQGMQTGRFGVLASLRT